MGISQQQALDCFASDDLIGIGMEADAVRRSLHPDGIVTYAVNRTFVISPGDEGMLDQIADAVSEGVTTIRLVASSAAGMSIEQLEAALAAVRGRFPALRIQALSAGEVAALAVTAGIAESALLGRLYDAGLSAIDGDTGDLPFARWVEIHRAAHLAGLRSRACLTFGGDLTQDEFVARLIALHTLQGETQGFTALSLHGFRPSNGRAEFEQPTAVEYLRTLAVARMVLDNFAHMESSSADEGLKVMQMALRFGADDSGTIPSTGTGSFTESDLRRVIRDAGFSPVERDTFYRTMFLNN